MTVRQLTMSPTRWCGATVAARSGSVTLDAQRNGGRATDAAALSGTPGQTDVDREPCFQRYCAFAR